MDQRGSYNPSASDHAAKQQDQEQQQRDRSDQADVQAEPLSHERAPGTTSGDTSAQSELEETRLLLKALDTIDTSMSEARDKLKVLVFSSCTRL